MSTRKRDVKDRKAEDATRQPEQIRALRDTWQLGIHSCLADLTVHLNGVDVYDPTTGQIRSSTTDDVACWVIDTDYDGQSFFVRHAYVTGADEPYDKLKRALRADIDESAWSTLYSTTVTRS